jgi:hypothetical protein
MKEPTIHKGVFVPGISGTMRDGLWAARCSPQADRVEIDICDDLVTCKRCHRSIAADKKKAAQWKSPTKF